MITETTAKPKLKRFVRNARVPGLAETARRLGRTKCHVYFVLTGQRECPHKDQYRRTHAEVLQEAGIEPTNPAPDCTTTTVSSPL